MELSKEALQEFYNLWLEDHPGQELSDAQLLENATRTIIAVQLTYKQIPK